MTCTVERNRGLVPHPSVAERERHHSIRVSRFSGAPVRTGVTPSIERYRCHQYLGTITWCHGNLRWNTPRHCYHCQGDPDICYTTYHTPSYNTEVKKVAYMSLVRPYNSSIGCLEPTYTNLYFSVEEHWNSAVDETLIMRSHVNSLYSRAHFYLRNISKIRHPLVRRTTATLVHAYATNSKVRLAQNLVHMCIFIWEWIYAKQIAPRDTRGHLGGGGFRGSNIQKSWAAVKRLHRLAPTLVHVCGFVWEWA